MVKDDYIYYSAVLATLPYAIQIKVATFFKYFLFLVAKQSTLFIWIIS